MFHTYDESLDWIHSRLRFGIKPGLNRMKWMLEKLDHPQKKIKAVHVGGTNGKGSTVAYCRSILVEAGYEVGTFTSPYIEQFNERISLNGRPISDDEITSLVNTIKPLADELEETELGSPTEFEIITAMAIYYFGVMNPVDITVFEVGLGGRYDSTNVIEPILTVITNVGMDHTQILGNSLEEIAYEKAGIIKQSTPIFTAVKDDRAFKVIQKEAKEKEAQLLQLGHDFVVKDILSTEYSERFAYKSVTETIENLEIRLLGHHQIENAAGAVAALLWLHGQGTIRLNKEVIRAGLVKANWPGRLEVLQKEPTIMVDGAHNPEGLRALTAALENRFFGKKLKVVFAALKDKDLTEMCTILNDMNAELYVTEFDFPRAATAEEFKKMTGNQTIITHSDWKILINNLKNTMQYNEVLVVTGSLYFISLVRPFLKDQIAKLNIE
ncbi:bifunctional folylpolyglutamate synthase/dihydrofolate synthase [Lederbergia lenta]|uniref:Dihydrofolate synthase/folylpolyglutamate synthase n=1 Tax=Lederbergia lenta TaxID=1467 RepID=A0A2X4WA89_LEDLE|nr:folylpolyglutamate synthase/dihydrofolate synthase family protein [Lederbergia lenta]MEC2325345.1 bifunctional folylpolyglutamate synthase/dihydrofolate synthase [Lederbergia lenta]SQI55792.1 bifunctional folylpolyglutamate synthase/ dihydrofolate synthase [Lederbergia lenta]